MSSNYEEWLLMAIFALSVFLIVYIQKSVNDKKKSEMKQQEQALSQSQKKKQKRLKRQTKERSRLKKAEMAKILAMRNL